MAGTMVVSSYAVTRNVLAPMRDGVRLAADLWLPTTNAPVPAVLFRTPYGRSAYHADVLRPQQCVEAGFAAIVQDMRGRSDSEGRWEPLNWAVEAEDTYDTVEWVAAQTWCSGAVGMSGVSYSGTVQHTSSLLRPPHLRAIAPTMASSPEFDRVESGGSLRLDLAISWLAVTCLDWVLRPGVTGLDTQSIGLILRAVSDPRFLYLTRPLRDLPLFGIAGFPITFDELYSRLNHPADANAIDLEIPTLHIGGWFDISHSTAVNLFRRQAAAGNQASHLVMGPWAHSNHLPQSQGQVNFGALASAGGARLPALVLDFFREHLAGESATVPRVKYFLMNSGNWYEDQAWPPPASEPQHLFLGTDGIAGSLTPSRPEGAAGADEYRYDPDDPTPTVGGRNLNVGRLSPGPISQEALHVRSDLLRYTGSSVTEPLDIVGAVKAKLFVSSSAVDTDFFVKLLDVDPAGVAVAVCEGGIPLRHRFGYDHEQQYSPGEVASLDVDLGHTAWRVLPDHRLALQIQSANFPQLNPNPNTGEPVGDSVNSVVATNTVLRDHRHASFLQFDAIQHRP
ncbi:MAG: CocE/NonD family hydrolase [Actinoplanes sp.]